MILVDASLLLFAVDRASPVHAVAARWLEARLNRASPVGLPWQSIGAFLRIATHPRASARPLSPHDAWTHVSEWLGCDVAWRGPPSQPSGTPRCSAASCRATASRRTSSPMRCSQPSRSSTASRSARPTRTSLSSQRSAGRTPSPHRPGCEAGLLSPLRRGGRHLRSRRSGPARLSCGPPARRP